jgi:hypothetical protein
MSILEGKARKHEMFAMRKDIILMRSFIQHRHPGLQLLGSEISRRYEIASFEEAIGEMLCRYKRNRMAV